MQNNLQRTTVYLDVPLKRAIEHIARASGRGKAEIMRDIMTEGINVLSQRTPSSAQNLLQLAGIIPKESGLPTDLATHHDKYAWE